MDAAHPSLHPKGESARQFSLHFLLKKWGEHQHYEVHQWNPGSQAYSKINGQDTYNGYLDLSPEEWTYVSHIPWPTIEQELAALNSRDPARLE